MKRFSNPERDLQVVELSQPPAYAGIPFIGVVTQSEVQTISLFFCAFIGLHWAMAWLCPSRRETQSRLYPLGLSPHDRFAYVDVTLCRIFRSHRYFSLNVSAVREHTQHNLKLPLNLTCSFAYKSSFQEVRLTKSGSAEDIHFSAGSAYSLPILKVREAVTNFDMVEMRMEIWSNFRDISALFLSWSSFNANSETFSVVVRASSGLFVAVVAVCFFAFSGLTYHKFWPALIGGLCMGVALSTHDSIVLLLVLATSLRAFLAVEQDLDKDHRPFVLGFFAAWGVLEFERWHQMNADKALGFEAQTAMTNLWEVLPAVMALLNLLAVVRCLTRMGSLALGSNLLALFNGFCAMASAAEDLMPVLLKQLAARYEFVDLMFESVHLTVAVFVVFLLHPTRETVYSYHGRTEDRLSGAGRVHPVEGAERGELVFDIGVE
jgi:hypothetical protein